MTIRAQFLVWLLVLLLPIAAAGLWTLHLINNTVEDRASQSLSDSLRLESARISEALARYRTRAEQIASDPAISILVTWNHEADCPSSAPCTATPERSTNDINPARLEEAVARALDTAARKRSDIVQLAIVDVHGTMIASSFEFTWQPADDTLVYESIATSTTRFGDAFREERWGEPRLGMVSPVHSPSGETVGALLLETRLGPVVDDVAAHKELSNSSEAHLAQRSPHGDAAFITPLRFDPEAAFSRIVPASAERPINKSLDAPQTLLLREPDYRNVPSLLAVSTLEETGWGLVVKIDEADVFGPVVYVRNAALLATLATLLAVVVAWLLLLNPLGIRLKRMAVAAERIAAGHLDTVINDRKRDDVGDTARTIDRLASELEADRQRRESVEARLRFQASHDELTGLHNRKHANEVIRSLGAFPDVPASIIFMDLDGFKAINDEHGHAAGDDILKGLARRLENTLSDQATIARWGGDEFVVILPNTDMASAAAVSQRVRRMFETPFATTSGSYTLSCSLGLSTSKPKRSLSEAVAAADQEMYAEKRSHRDETSAEAFQVRTVANALDEQRVEIWLQPIMHGSSGRSPSVAGAEVLVRLRSRDGGVINPNEFLAAIRARPMGRELDSFVLEHAIRCVSDWLKDGRVDPNFRLSLNVNSISLSQTDLVDEISLLLERYQVSSRNIVIEVPQSPVDIKPGVLEGLRKTGVRIALDDIGLHHSSLDSLVSLAPDIAKLDRQWMDNDVVLPRLIDLCQTLGLELVAEGVETEQQLTRLQSLAVTHFQGYLFDGPRVAEQFIEKWGKQSRLAAGRPLTARPG